MQGTRIPTAWNRSDCIALQSIESKLGRWSARCITLVSPAVTRQRRREMRFRSGIRLNKSLRKVLRSRTDTRGPVDGSPAYWRSPPSNPDGYPRRHELDASIVGNSPRSWLDCPHWFIPFESHAGSREVCDTRGSDFDTDFSFRNFAIYLSRWPIKFKDAEEREREVNEWMNFI